MQDDVDPAEERAAMIQAQSRLVRARAQAHDAALSSPRPLADLQRLTSRLSSIVASDAYQREADATRAALRADVERKRAGLLEIAARVVEIPEDEDLRAVVMRDQVPVTPALAAFREAAAWRGRSARGCIRVVGGPRGTGKSCAAAHVALRLNLDHDTTALYVTAARVAASPDNGYSDNTALWDRWVGARVLVVDDLGAELGDRSNDVLASLLLRRYDGGGFTMVPTNLQRGELAARYFGNDIGQRLADRLVNAQGRALPLPAGEGGRAVGEGGLLWYVPVAGESMRRVEVRSRLPGWRGQ